MKRFLLTIILGAGLAPAMKAQNSASDGVTADSVRLERNGKLLSVDMTLQLSALEVKSSRAVLLTPRLVNGGNSAELPSVGIYGRQRYYHYVRGGESMLTGKDEISFRVKDCPRVLSYNQVLAYEPWMDGATLTLHRQDYGCCSELLAEEVDGLASFHEVVFTPAALYLQPAAEGVKERSLEGSAFIDFVVNKTDIRPDYRGNRSELAKIIASIDSVKNDADIRITALHVKGFASPEGSYESNARLAEGRTESLRRYVEGLYDFPEGFIRTSYEPEDWKGLRAYVEASGLEHRQEILDAIDSSLAPDAREWRIKSRYQQDYRILLQECYPALRHSDYRVEYVIRNYTDVEEIRRIMQTAPQKLSLNEFYLLAQTMEPGSDEFGEVFETAVRMYPQDEVANLNAAFNALRKGDLPSAKSRLGKAGDSPQAVYARGVYAYLAEDHEAARTLLEQAEKAGVTEAADALDEWQLR